MIVICAWCGLPQPDKEPLTDNRTTHGMCEACEKAMNEKLKFYRRQNLKRKIDIGNAAGYLLLAWTVMVMIIQTVIYLKR